MTTVGILGGGQLSRMLALSGYPLGLHFQIYDPATTAPVDGVAPHIIAEYSDETALAHFAETVDVITYEFENVPVATAEFLAQSTPVYPPPLALAVAQDRLTEKTFLRKVGIPTPAFVAVDSLMDLERAVATIDIPAVLKTRRMGYDGKGQYVIRQPEDVVTAWEALAGTSLILEGFVNFDRELSILAARNRSGQIAMYPLVQNTHRDGILRLTIAPAPAVDATLQSLATTYATAVLEELDYVGILAIELFQVGSTLLANEMAPRVHNSGHWTIEGAATSQFAQHLRAILDLPLGMTTVTQFVAMVNLIGNVPPTEAVLRIPNTYLHLYDKSPRPGRKLGHITIIAATDAERAERIEQVQSLLAAIPSF